MTFQKMLSCLFMARGRNNDPGIAIVRAIAEAAQPRLMRVESAQRDIAEAILVRAKGYYEIKKRIKHWFKANGGNRRIEGKRWLGEVPKVHIFLFCEPFLIKLVLKGLKKNCYANLMAF